MARLGYHVPVSADIRPKQLADFLKQIEGSPEEEFINELMLRSMKKAVYQRENVGHFGLAFKHYAHFTSPIRRYPDLLIHRLLRKRKSGKYPAAFARKVNAIIDRVGEHCSETERNAEQAEREAVKVKQVSFMAQHIGKEYDGVISGVIGAGFFVRLDNIFAEGMVRISMIDDDYYRYDEKNYRFVGSRHGRVFRMGQRVKVGIERVDIERREITLYLVEEEDRPKRGKARSKSKSKSRSKPKEKRGRKKSRRRKR
jgi:ribonuclease R